MKDVICVMCGDAHQCDSQLAVNDPVARRALIEAGLRAKAAGMITSSIRPNRTIVKKPN